MIILRVLIYVTVLFGCKFDNNKIIITITGVADNAKAGAFVLSKADGKAYYLEGIHSWDDKIKGKTIKVSGELFVEKREKSKDGILRQEIIGEKLTLLKPKWEFVK